MSRPGSRHSSRPGSSAGRAPAPAHMFEMVDVDVPMGGMAFVDKSTGAYTRITSVGGASSKTGTVSRIGASTRGLTACFAVAVIGSGGAILAHVSAYLGHDPRTLTTAQKAELDTMTRAFATLFRDHKSALTPCTVAVIDGENTTPAQRNFLMGKIFAPLYDPKVAPKTHQLPLACQQTPYPRTAAHGTVAVLLTPGNQLYVEDRKKL